MCCSSENISRPPNSRTLLASLDADAAPPEDGENILTPTQFLNSFAPADEASKPILEGSVFGHRNHTPSLHWLLFGGLLADVFTTRELRDAHRKIQMQDGGLELARLFLGWFKGVEMGIVLQNTAVLNSSALQVFKILFANDHCCPYCFKRPFSLCIYANP